MSAPVVVDRSHPVLRAVAAIEAELAAVAEVPVWSMAGPELAGSLEALHRVRSRLAALELRVVAQAAVVGVGTDGGAADTTAWWAVSTVQTKRDAHRRVAVATALQQRPIVRSALTSGEVAEDQATVIVRALAALPADVESSVVDLAEKELVRLAEHHDAADLTRLGKRILDVVAPEVGEAQERQVLEREEETAASSRRFTMADDGHGRCHGRFTLPSVEGAMLRKALLALAAPRHRAASSPLGEPRPSPERLGQAFGEYVGSYPVDRLAKAGGVSAAVVVTMDLATLTGDGAPATLDTGQRISPGEARRLACQAGIIPAVLGGASKVLDLGRRKRFHTPAQRIAIALRDQTCTADGCDCPPALCHVHHDQPWSKGGRTDIATGRLLCPRHHSYAHSPKRRMKALTNGRVVFARC